MISEAEISGVRYRIDASRSSFTVQSFAEGMLSFMGHNPTFAVRRYGGEVRFAPGNQKADSMLLVVQANTLTLLDRLKEKDRAEIENTMREEVLETHQYPEIVFVSKDIAMRQIAETVFEVEIDGKLSLHGVTQRYLIKAEAEIDEKGLRAKGGFTLRQSDFNIKPVKALGGTLKVKDEVNVSFDIATKV
jgi:polyisoprenoid-binding protein YceI